MTEKETALAPRGQAEIQALQSWGNFAIKAGVVPKELTVYQAMAIIEMGRELSLPPLKALKSMCFIKGRLSMGVQLQLAMAKRGGVTTPKGWLKEGDGNCTVTLCRGAEEVTCAYTLADAQKARLVIKDGNWDKYPKQMLRWRAIGDALRLIAPDLVLGLLSPEEAESLEPFEPLALLPEREESLPEAKEELSLMPSEPTEAEERLARRKELEGVVEVGGMSIEQGKAWVSKWLEEHHHKSTKNMPLESLEQLIHDLRKGLDLLDERE